MARRRNEIRWRHFGRRFQAAQPTGETTHMAEPIAPNELTCGSVLLFPAQNQINGQRFSTLVGCEISQFAQYPDRLF